MATERTVVKSITGHPHEIIETVNRLRESGRLVAMTAPRPVPGGRARIVLTLTAPPSGSGRRRRTHVLIGVCVAAASAIIGGSTMFVWHVASGGATSWARGAGFTLLLALAALFLRPNHRVYCRGQHCPGCRGGR